jgi:hypothetical protein
MGSTGGDDPWPTGGRARSASAERETLSNGAQARAGSIFI